MAMEGGAGVDTLAASHGVEDMLTGTDNFVAAVSPLEATAEPILMPATVSAEFPSFDPVLAGSEHTQKQGCSPPDVTAMPKNRLRRPSAVVLRAAAAAHIRRNASQPSVHDVD